MHADKYPNSSRAGVAFTVPVVKLTPWRAQKYTVLAVRKKRAKFKHVRSVFFKKDEMIEMLQRGCVSEAAERKANRSVAGIKTFLTVPRANNPVAPYYFLIADVLQLMFFFFFANRPHSCCYF